MNIEGLNLNLDALSAPKSLEQIIWLLDEACTEMQCVNAHLEGILENAQQPA